MFNRPELIKRSAGLNRAIDLWAPYFQPDIFQVVYVGRGDEQWLESKSLELGLQSMVPPGETWTIRMKMFNPCGFAMAGVANNVPTFVQCLDPAYSGGHRQTGPHEYTHLFQRGVGGSSSYRMAWYNEGSASYFGWTLGFFPYDPNSIDRTRWLANLFSNISEEAKLDFKSKDLQRLKSRMQNRCSKFQCAISFKYFLLGRWLSNGSSSCALRF